MASATVVLIILDSGFVALAFPEIEREFSTTPRSTLSWVSSGYFIALASLMLLAGGLAERFGQKRIFIGGIGIYAVGAIAMATAPAAWVVIGARLLQGAGAAALTPVSLAIALPEFPTSRRSTAIAGWAVVGGLSGVVAPTLGAIVVDLGGWRAPFVLLVGLLGLVAVAAVRTLRPDRPASNPQPIDALSVPLTFAAIGGLAIALSKGRDWGLADSRTLASLIIGLVCLPLLLRRSQQKNTGLIDLSLFRIGSYTKGSLASVTTQLGFFAFFFTSPLFFTEVWGYSVLAAGLALALQQGTSALFGLPLGRITERFGAGAVVGAGGIVASLSFVWLVLMVDESPNFWVAIAPAFIIGGLGTMANGAMSTSLAFREIGDANLGMASSGYYVTRRIASGLGVVLGAAILGDATGGDSLGRFKLVWAVAAAAYFLSGLSGFADHKASSPPS